MPQPSLSRSHLSARLRDATATVRDDRDILAGRVSWLDYRLYLVRMYGFYAAVERALTASRGLKGVLADSSLRNHKASLLAHDLVALGVDRRDLMQCPRMTFAGALPLVDAVGWTYVVESTCLSSKQLMRHLVRQLPTEMETASAFLGCYGDDAQQRFREMAAAIDAYDEQTGEGDRVVEVAREGFLQLHAWVRPAVQPRPSRIHA